MNVSVIKLAEAPQNSIFPITIRNRGAKPQAAAPNPKSKKRDNVFSKSRDKREDRGTREMKTRNNPKTFFQI